MRILQVTLGAGTRTQLTAARIITPFLIIQNNSAHTMRVGDNTVTASRGLQLNLLAGGGGGQITIQRADNNINLSTYFVAGTAGDVVDVFYE